VTAIPKPRQQPKQPRRPQPALPLVMETQREPEVQVTEKARKGVARACRVAEIARGVCTCQRVARWSSSEAHLLEGALAGRRVGWPWGMHSQRRRPMLQMRRGKKVRWEISRLWHGRG